MEYKTFEELELMIGRSFLKCASKRASLTLATAFLINYSLENLDRIEAIPLSFGLIGLVSYLNYSFVKDHKELADNIERECGVKF